MSVLNLWNYFSVSSQGAEKTGKQGAITDAAQTPFAVTVDGLVHEVTGQIATATVKALWDDDDDLPATVDYFFFVADQNCYLQFVGAAVNFTVPILAKVPFVLSGNTILAAANNTDITGGSEPAVVEIDHINCGNYSGSTLNFHVAVID